MAKRKSKQDEANERAVDVEHLSKELQKTARELGFRQRVSLNKIGRSVEHEKWTERLCLGFVGLTGLAAVGFFVARFFVHQEKRGEFLGIAVFAAMWGGLSWVLGYRAKRRQHGLAKLDEVVRERLGK